MCGIVGILNKKTVKINAVDQVSAALKTLTHRGPDASNVVQNGAVTFGHTRLSIIDTSSQSNQPFVSDDQQYMITFNGEIYNYIALREELEAKGVCFKTNSDTEVLFQLLIHEGKEAVNKLDGFFAFAFYAKPNKTILLARDRMGIKPLLVYEDEAQLIFGSELQLFHQFEGVKQIDKEAFNSFLGFTYIPAPATIYTNVKKIRPGECLTIKVGEEKATSQKEKYYQPVVKPFDGTYVDAQQQLYKLLENSVENRMVADVPLGCFLSGGVDSSIIAALAIKNKPTLQTFSIGFDHPYFNEADYANEVAEHIGSNHHVYTLTKKDFKANFSAFLNTIDEPFADSSAFAVYLLAQYTKQHVTVALSGDGADELFGGYRKHYAEYKIKGMNDLKKRGIKGTAKLLKGAKSSRSDKWGDLNRKLQKLAKGLSLSYADRYWDWCSFVSADEREKVVVPAFYKPLENPFKFDENADGNAMLLADQAFVLPNDMLRKVDAMSMANSLEVRTPFLDHKVVEFANSLPFDFKINKEGGKQVLKDAFAHLLPPSVMNRPKKGFEIPIKEWLGDELNEMLNGPLFNKAFIQEQGIFELDTIVNCIKHWNEPDFGDRIYLIWELIIFQHWWQNNQSYITH